MKRSNHMAHTLLKVAGAAVLTAALAGCSGIHGELDDNYQPAIHYQQHPITVTKGMVKMQVPAHSSRLSGAHEDAVIRFAQQAKDHDAAAVFVRRPSGSVSADVVAGKVTQLMASQGVTPSTMKHSTYKGHGPVEVSYSRHFASTNECGDWSHDLSRTGDNDLPPDFGCAQQHNLAALVANPKDFVQPRTSTGTSAQRRVKTMTDYVEGNDTNSAKSGNETVEISGAVN